MHKRILGAILPGNSTAELKEFDMPTPGYGQVVVKTKASTICGSDIRAIYPPISEKVLKATSPERSRDTSPAESWKSKGKA